MWRISQLREFPQNRILDLEPDYQRRPVWNAKTQMLFIDSLARGVPAGAITVYEDESRGYKAYEVIDGKQRLTALTLFLKSELTVRDTITKVEEEEEDLTSIGTELAQAVYEAGTWEELESKMRLRFDEYEFPVFVVTGSRSEAVRAFTRMNSNVYSLKPQEIRNAVFAKTRFLQTAIDTSESLTAQLMQSGEPFFVELGIMTRDANSRMQDVQLVLELLILILHGAQHRRDELDAYCDLYREPGPAARRRVEDARVETIAICEQIWSLFRGEPIQALHFPKPAENDFYALFGALHLRGTLSKTQLANLGDDLVAAISEFRRQVALYTSKVREGVEPGDEFAAQVTKYAGTFLGGQVNSQRNRNERINIWAEVMNDVVDTIDETRFSTIQRHLIWAMNPEKLCARCAESVEFRDYHAGHRVSRAVGGRSVLTNGQVEHQTCNQQAGAEG